jgi:predicted nuclease of predicted toxin-antitoxin system
MLFKIDENLPVEIATILSRAGYDAMTILDQNMVGHPDTEVIKVCYGERRVLMTLDLDFSDIRTYPPRDHAGILVLRPRSQSKSAVEELVIQLLPLLQTESLTGKLWIASEHWLRVCEG